MNGTRPLIPFNRPHLGPEEVSAAGEAILKGNVSGNGSLGLEVEKKLESIVGAKHVLLMTSCTHAMELALVALGVGPGDEVLLPSFTFVSTANAILMAGARPVFVDVRLDDLTIDPESAAEKVGSRTKALLVVHYAGVSCQMDALNELARNSGMFVVEDAAHALGATWKGAQLGGLGDIGCVSFHGTKNVVCGEGGALITNNSGVAREIEVIREKGTNRSAFMRGEVERYTWISKGSSYVLSEVLAAILKVQLEKMSWIISEREKIWKRYADAFAPLAGKERVRLCGIPSGAVPNWHIFYLLTASPADRDGLIRHLGASGIESSFHFIPLHSSPFSVEKLGYGNVSLPVTEYVSPRLLRLPIYPGLKKEDQDRVIDSVLSYFRGSGKKRHFVVFSLDEDNARGEPR